MNQLRCSAGTCAANRDGLCCRPELHVDGSRARASRETCCGSFQEEIRGVTDMVMGQTPDPRCEILCDAQNCVHWCNGCCAAAEVHIAGNGAADAGDTACRSFRDKA